MFKEVGKGSKASGDTYVPVLGPPESRATVQWVGHFSFLKCVVFYTGDKKAIWPPTTWRERTAFQERWWDIYYVTVTRTHSCLGPDFLILLILPVVLLWHALTFKMCLIYQETRKRRKRFEVKLKELQHAGTGCLGEQPLYLVSILVASVIFFFLLSI